MGGGSRCSSRPCRVSPQLQLYQSIIFATPIFFAFLLLFLFFIVYLRQRRNARMQMGVQVSQRPQFFSQQLQVDHGLSKSFRQRLPTVAFDEKFATMHENAQCAVCLGDYQLNEKLQQLPLCNHAFHIECIDRWLAKNNTCPMCRALLQSGARQQGQSQLTLRESAENRLWEEWVMSAELDLNGLRLSRREDVNDVDSTSMVSDADPSLHMVESMIHIERS